MAQEAQDASEAQGDGRMVPTRFWTYQQNNSGGHFDHVASKGIGYALAVEAVDKDHADARFRSIVDSYGASSDCPCCGRRWSDWTFGEGDLSPSLYDGPLRGSWGIPSYTHYLDGRIVEAPAGRGTL